MGHHARGKEAGRGGTTPRRPAPQRGATESQGNPESRRTERPAPPGRDRNEVRRLKYALDPEYAERAKQVARDTYRKGKPLAPSKLSNGLLAEGQQREVSVEGMDEPMVVETFTVPEAAKALGKSELTFKRWIREELVPPPILHDTRRGYAHYSVGELTVLARELAKHEQQMSYYSLAHEVTQHAIWQAMQAYRASGI